MLTRLTDLAGKWLKVKDTREKVIDSVVQEQFIDVLPEEARVWVKERKPCSSTEAGKLAEDFRQARKEAWDSTAGRNIRSREGRRCYNCKRTGHIAKDCHQVKEKDGKDAEKTKYQGANEEQKSKGIVCFNCKVRGHVAKNCTRVMLCQARSAGQGVRRSRELLCRGEVEGHRVDDIQLDTGCSKTVVRGDLVDKKKILEGESVMIQCAHGDTVSYPLAKVKVVVRGRVVMVEAAVSETLPRSVLLGTDVPQLSELLEDSREKRNGGVSFAVLTRRQARRQKEEERERQQKEKESGAKPTALETEEEQTEEKQTEEEQMKPLEDKERREDEEEDGLQEFDFADEVFSEKTNQKKRQTRAEKRDRRMQHARSEKEKTTRREWVLNLSREELRRLQEKDNTLQNLGKGPSGLELVKKDGILYRQWRPRQGTGEPVEQLVLPQACRKTALELAHQIPLAGHMGRDKTARRIQQRFYWPTLFKDVAEYCRSCPDCQKTDSRGQRKMPLVPLPIIQEPFSRIAMDIVGPLPRSRKGNRYILVVCDYSTRFPEAIPLRSIDAQSVAEELINFFARVGILREILTDQGSNFMSQLLQEMYRLMKIHPIRTSPYHPQTDGLVERFNKTLKAMLRRLIKEEGRDWDKLVPYVLFAYREIPQTSTGFSPFELLYGREVRGPLDVLKEEWEAKEQSKESVVSHILQIRERMQAMQELVGENLEEAQQRQKRWYDKTARKMEFKPEDKVLILLPTSTNKLLGQWKGPYQIVRKAGEVNYEVRISRRRTKVLHANLLKQWHEREEEGSFFCGEIAEGETSDEDCLARWMDRVDCSTVKIDERLNEEQRRQLQRLLDRFKEVLKSKPGRTTLTEHRIRVKKTNQPVRQHPYRIPYAYRTAVEKELKEMEREGIIESSKSDWASPMVIVKKKDGSLRICVDYRKLNAVTEMDAYPMPRIDDILDQIGQAKYLTTLDLARGYWQVPVAKEDQHITAFTTPFGLYQFKVMPFGLSGAPASFQRLMDVITKDTYQFAHAYLDDLVIFSSSWEEHLEQLAVILGRLEEGGLTVKPSKCQFGVTECEYLGHRVGGGKVRPLKDKVEAINSFPVPEDKKQVPSFLGLVGYYKKFIPDFASVAAPLTELTKKTEPQLVRWTSKCNEAFLKLRSALTSHPLLWSPDFSRPFLLQTDASEFRVGAVLGQEDDEGLDHPVSYFSHKLLPRQRNYSTVEKECLAIKLGIEAFQVYLMGRSFVIQTDHRALQWLNSVKDQNSRLLRWSLALQPFSFEVRHRKGRENANADTLSRVDCP